MKDEKAVWEAFRDRLPVNCGIWAKRIEDSSGDLGTWDTLLMREGRCAWIEFKHTVTLRRKPKQRQGQFAFGCKLHENGTPGIYIVGASDKTVRVFNGLMREDDWKGHMIADFERWSPEAVDWILERLKIGT